MQFVIRVGCLIGNKMVILFPQHLESRSHHLECDLLMVASPYFM